MWVLKSALVLGFELQVLCCGVTAPFGGLNDPTLLFCFNLSPFLFLSFSNSQFMKLFGEKALIICILDSRFHIRREKNLGFVF
ncbi:hypothetical protein DMA11_21050 [Marinilabiliaceae bacterium JC017]|nr:hypothetical protein DMA11_21050 [Marinilabiliaceae bacterium JC017]